MQFNYYFLGQGSLVFNDCEIIDYINKLDRNNPKFQEQTIRYERQTVKRNRIFLDVGNRLKKGVLDHHGTYKAAEYAHKCTAGLVAAFPELILSNIDYDINTVDIVLHYNPDFDCFAAAYMAKYIIENKRLPDNYEFLVRYTEEIDAGKMLIEPSQLVSPYSIYHVIGEVVDAPDFESANIKSMERGIRLIEVCMESLKKVGSSRSFDHPLLIEDLSNEFKKEILFIKDDYQKYEDDLVKRVDKERTRIRLPLNNPLNSKFLIEVDALFWNEMPTCVLHKLWARQDKKSPSGRGYVFTFIPLKVNTKNEYNVDTSRVIISVKPDNEVCLKGLAKQLEASERKAEAEHPEFKGNVSLWRGRYKKRFNEEWCDSEDPWYDGRDFDFTIVDSPKIGSLLSIEKIKEITINFMNPVITGGTIKLIFPFSFQNSEEKKIRQTLDSLQFTSESYEHIQKRYFLPYIQEYLFSSNLDNNKITTHYRYKKQFSIKSLVEEALSHDNNEKLKQEYKNHIGKFLDNLFTSEGIEIFLFKYNTCLVILDLKIDSNRRIILDELLNFNHFIYDLDVSLFNYFKSMAHSKNYLNQNSMDRVVTFKVMGFVNLDLEPETFDKSMSQEMIFKLCNFIRWNEVYYQSKYIERTIHKMFMDVGDTIYYGFSKNGGALITVENSSMTELEKRRIARAKYNFENIEIYIFLLVLQQKIALEHFSHRLFQYNIQNKWNHISKLRAYLNNFIAEGYFGQITTNEVGSEFYRQWRSNLEVEELYKEVCDQLKSVDEFNKSKTSGIISKWSYVLFPILTISSLMSMTNSIFSLSDNLSVSVWKVAVAITLFAFLFHIVNTLLRKRK
jgi:hypothetical protein